MPSAEPRVSVVIPSYNMRETIGAAVRSLLAQELDEPFEVLVADSSDDDTARYLAERFAEARVITLPRRSNAATARNRGVEEARGELLVFTDADCVAPPGWLRRIVAAARERDGLVGGSVDVKPPHDLWGLLLHAVAFAEFLPSHEWREVRFVPACNLAIPKEQLLACGGFPAWSARTEDLVLGELYRRRFGRGALFAGDAPVVHEQRRGLGRALRHQWQAGLSSGADRRRLPLRGHVVTRWPALALFVPFARAAAVIVRSARSRHAAWLTPLLLATAPLVVALLAAWTAGFVLGARVELAE